MNTKSENRKRWGDWLLIASGVFLAGIFIGSILPFLAVPWADWGLVLVGWTIIPSFPAILLFLIKYLSASPPPSQIRINPWAIMGGVFGLFVILFTNCCTQDDVYWVACFGPMLSLVFGILGAMFHYHLISIILVMTAPFIGYYFKPYVGEEVSLFATYLILIGAGGTSIYLRLTRGVPGYQATIQNVQRVESRCPQCGATWASGQTGKSSVEQCTNCGWSWIDDLNIDRNDLPSFLLDDDQGNDGSKH